MDKEELEKNIYNGKIINVKFGSFNNSAYLCLRNTTSTL